MAIILIEEVLVGLEEVKVSLEQALTTLDVLVDDLHPQLGEALRTTLEHEFLEPIRSRIVALEHLQTVVEASAT